ncbi:MAG: BrnA antitoxin family protein [Clostridiales Family XIII bacterium]|jgi:predicted DNA binding CopG/RHH family protein|nr:BrnA antitoxin family protein [Clostridiales Family XIII bacterium]
MREEYNFSHARRGRLAGSGKQQITIRIAADAIKYFKELSVQTGVPYQTLMNFYLLDCAKKKKRPELSWESAPGATTEK